MSGPHRLKGRICSAAGISNSAQNNVFKEITRDRKGQLSTQSMPTL
jgi:hypothetical protein